MTIQVEVLNLHKRNQQMQHNRLEHPQSEYHQPLITESILLYFQLCIEKRVERQAQ